MFALKSLKFVLLFFILLPFKCVQNLKIVKLVNLDCTAMHPHLFNYTQCKLEEVKDHMFEVTVAVEIFQKPINEGQALVILTKRGYENRPPFLKQTIDCCGFLGNRRRYPVGNFFYNLLGLEKYSNMNHSCPYKEDLLVVHYPFNGKFVKMIPFGNGEFDLTVKFFVSKVLVLIVKVYFKVIEQISV